MAGSRNAGNSHSKQSFSAICCFPHQLKRVCLPALPCNLAQDVLQHIESSDTVIVRPATTSFTVSDFLDIAIENAQQPANRENNHSVDAAYYLEYLQLDQYIPDLVTDAFIPEYASFLKKTHHNVWVGASTKNESGTVGKMHFDP